MTRRGWRILGWIGVGLLGLIALVIGTVWVGLSSERVARWAVGKVSGDSTLTVERVHGPLRGPLALAGVRVHRPSADLAIDSLVVEWNPAGLLHREIRLDALHIIGLQVTIPDSTPPSPGPPERPSLPIGIILRNATVQRLSVSAPGGVRVVAGRARVSGRATDYRLAGRASLILPQFDSIPQLDTLEIGLWGSGDLVHLQLDSAVAPMLRGRLEADGLVTWWPIVSWNLAAAGRGLRPGLLSTDPGAWPGVVSLAGAVAGLHDSTGTYGRVRIDTLGGTLRRQRLTGRAVVRLLGSTARDQTAIAIPELTARWGSATLALSGYAGDTLAIELGTRLDRLGTLVASAGGRLDADGVVRGERSAPRLIASVRGRGLRFGSDSLARLSAAADLVFAPDGKLQLRATGQRGNAGAVRVASLALRVDGTRGQHRVSFNAAGPRLRTSLLAVGGLSRQRWRGRLDSLRLDARPVGPLRLRDPVHLSLGAAADSIARFCLDQVGSAPAALCGSVAWRSVRAWQIAARLEGLPLALLDSLRPDSVLVAGARLIGRADATIALRAENGRLSGDLRAATRDAALLYPEQPGDTALERVIFDSLAVSAQAGADGVQGSLTLRFVAADRSPIGHLRASLALLEYRSVDQPLARQPVRFRADGAVDNLAVTGVFPSSLDSLTGRVEFQAEASGLVQSPRLRSELRAEQVAAWLGEERVARGAVRVELAGAVAPDRAVAGSLTVVPRGVVYEYPLAGVSQRLVVDSGGIRVLAADSGLASEAALSFSDGSGDRLGSIAGGLHLPGYHGRGRPAGDQPIDLRLQADFSRLSAFQALTARFDTLAGRLRLDLAATGTMAAPQVRGSLAVQELHAVLPAGARVDGGVLGELTGSVGTNHQIAGRLRLVPQSLRIGAADSAVPPVLLADTGLTARVGPDGAQARLELRFASPAAGQLGALEGQFAMPGYTRTDQPMGDEPFSARLAGGLGDLGFLAGFSPQIDSLRGTARVNLAAEGTPSHARLSGGLALDSVTAGLPLLGVVYRNLDLTAQADSGGRIAVAGRVSSGPGELRLRGSTPLLPTVKQPARFHVEGSRFEAIHTERVHAIVTPSVDLTVAGDSIDAQGQVELPLVAIHLTDMPESVVPPSGDVVFVGDSTPVEPTGWKIASQIQLILGDSVTFQGFNFTAQLGGRLLLRQSPTRPPTASGALVIEHGRYKAYGQDLTIEQGQIRFAGGPAANPTLAIEATRTARDSVVAGLRIGGTLHDPTVELFSTPAMSQDRALAYIVLGHAPGESSGSNGTLIAKAVNSLGLRGGNYLARSVGQSLGLANAHIETNSDLQQASFVAGKYLSPNLYVSYGIGLFDPVSTVRLQYEISRHWSLQAERGATTGADILFQTERGLKSPASGN